MGQGSTLWTSDPLNGLTSVQKNESGNIFIVTPPAKDPESSFQAEMIPKQKLASILCQGQSLHCTLKGTQFLQFAQFFATQIAALISLALTCKMEKKILSKSAGHFFFARPWMLMSLWHFFWEAVILDCDTFAPFLPRSFFS